MLVDDNYARICLWNLGQVLRSSIFNPIKPHVLLRSAVTSVLIDLKDILKILERNGHKVDFTDDVGSGANDITHLVTLCRNAACHISSNQSKIDSNIFIFNTAFGRSKIARFGYKLLESQHEDDVAFFWGETSIYFKRHIARATLEAVKRVFDGERYFNE